MVVNMHSDGVKKRYHGSMGRHITYRLRSNKTHSSSEKPFRTQSKSNKKKSSSQATISNSNTLSSSQPYHIYPTTSSPLPPSDQASIYQAKHTSSPHSSPYPPHPLPQTSTSPNSPRPPPPPSSPSHHSPSIPPLPPPYRTSSSPDTVQVHSFPYSNPAA